MKQTQPAKAAEKPGGEPSLKELCEEYPQEWEKVQRELASIISAGKPEKLHGYLKSMQARKSAGIGGRGSAKDSRQSQAIQYLMARLAVKQHYVAVASGVESGKIRFNLLNGMIAQKLLFSDGLERKPVSMFWFRMLWPLVWQKRLLMPLVQPEGIYCFYSRQLIDDLARLIGKSACVEVAAGDGTLTRFLKGRGVQVTATDDYSWEHSVTYPDWVVRRDARDALSEYMPEVVICSWPPVGNSFERQIFRARSVSLYIVIGSRHRHAAGNWADYEEQTRFSFEEDKRLSSLVLPPELDSAVYLFRRK